MKGTVPGAHREGIGRGVGAAGAAGPVARAALPSRSGGTHGKREFVGWFSREPGPAVAVPSSVIGPEVSAEHARLAAGAVSGALVAAEW